MRFEYSILSVLAAFAAVQAQDVDNNDVPNECRQVCASAIGLSQRCDRDNDDYIRCVCSAPEIGNVPPCEACVAFYDRNDGRDNDVNDIVRSCGLSSTTWNPSATPSVGGASPSAPATNVVTQPTGTSVVGGVSSGVSSVVGSATSSVGGVVTSAVGSATSRVGSATSAATGAVSSFTGAANGLAPPVGGLAAAVIGLLNFV